MILDKTLQTDLIDKYKQAKKKLLLLDYDGTLVEYRPKPDQAFPSVNLLKILGELAEKPDSELIIITGRDSTDIESLIGQLQIDIIAGHGATWKENGVWKRRVSDEVKWKEPIRPILESMSLQCNDSFIEDKNLSLAWHYRNADHNSGYEYSRRLIKQLEKFRDQYSLKILDGNRVVEIMCKEIGKGNAVEKLLTEREYDFILSIGDDVTDEEIFIYLKDKNEAATIKVGNGTTAAKYYFRTVPEVILFINQLSA